MPRILSDLGSAAAKIPERSYFTGILVNVSILTRQNLSSFSCICRCRRPTSDRPLVWANTLSDQPVAQSGTDRALA